MPTNQIVQAIGILIILFTSPIYVNADESKAQEFVKEGKIFAQNGKYDDAIKSFSEAIKQSPGIVEAYIKRGDCLLGRRQFRDALSDYSEAVKLDPNSYDGHLGLGLCILASNPKSLSAQQQARLDIGKALAIDPNKADSHIAKYHLYMWQKAVRTTRSATSLELMADKEREKALAIDANAQGYFEADTLPFMRLRNNIGEKDRLADLAKIRDEREKQMAADRAAWREEALNAQKQMIQAEQEFRAEFEKRRKESAEKRRQEDMATKTFRVSLFKMGKDRITVVDRITRYMQARTSAEAANRALEENKGYSVSSSILQK